MSLSMRRLARRLLAPGLAVAIACLGPAAGAWAQELRGHGGPVRALSVAPDGRIAISGSFDSTAILWGLDAGVALAVLRLHDGAVNAVAALPDGRFVTAGEDGRLALWRPGSREPAAAIKAHDGPIAALALSPDGARLASASWDGTARVGAADLAGEGRVIAGHRGPVNAVAFTPDGRGLITGGHDATLRATPLDGAAPLIRQLESPVNAVLAFADGVVAAAGADSQVRLFDAGLSPKGAVKAAETPIVALAASPDGRRIAAAAIRGSVALIDRSNLTIQKTLVGPGLPVWSIAFRPDGSELLTGGGDRLIRRWDAATGEHLGAVAMARPADLLAEHRGDRGAEVFRACVACHTLTPDDGARAGPTLHGVIGRRIGVAAGYDFSPALRNMDIVWTRETIARLFEIGPNAYTPGTKMPEQIITDPEDREALVDFIARVTAPR